MIRTTGPTVCECDEDIMRNECVYDEECECCDCTGAAIVTAAGAESAADMTDIVR